MLMYSSRLSSLGVVCLGWTAHLQSFYHSNVVRGKTPRGTCTHVVFCRRFYLKKIIFFFFSVKPITHCERVACRQSLSAVIVPKTPSTAIHRPKPEYAVSTGIAATTVVRAMVFTDVSMRTLRAVILWSQIAYTSSGETFKRRRIQGSTLANEINEN